MIKIVAEIGINHNGDINIAKKLIDIASISGFDYVKFQKRDPEICVPDKQKNIIRETPWGKIRYIEYKHKLEFSFGEYAEISIYCAEKGIEWFASAWDIKSAEFLKGFSSMVKIPSALITDLKLIKYCRNNFDILLISTGMSTEEEIERAVRIGQPNVIFHANSCYPAEVDELALKYISWLSEKYPLSEIGYSGHEFGIVTTLATVALGVTWIERHVSIDRMSWGSDQLSSVEPVGMFKMVKGIRDIEKAMTGFGERKLLDSEKKKREELRK